MTVEELGRKLREMYETKGANKPAMVHLFGILYADIMKNNNITATEVVRVSQIPYSYHAEVTKGINLSKYVTVKPEFKDKF